MFDFKVVTLKEYAPAPEASLTVFNVLLVFD